MFQRFHEPPQLVPAQGGGGAIGHELIVVEGESAGVAVAAARDARTQAVLPFQGKPLNPLRHGKDRVLKHAAYAVLLACLGAAEGAPFRLERCPYERVLLLFDPDADGVHAAALTLLFFAEFLPELIEAERVLQVRAPIATVEHERLTEPIDAVSRADLDRVLLSLREHGVSDPERRLYRGLASIDAHVLARACLDPASRVATTLSLEQARRVRTQLGL